MTHIHLILTLAILFGFLMAWGIGANDVANAVGTSVGAKVLTLRQAIVIAVVFESAGAMLAGGQVTDTIRSKIVDFSMLNGHAELFACGMLASLLAAAIWLVIASRFGWPVSTTHSIIGAIFGFAIVTLGPSAIYWNQMGAIVASWVVSPIMAGGIAFLLFRSVRLLVFDSKNPIQNAKRYVPCYIFLVTLILSIVTLLKGLKPIAIHLAYADGVIISITVSLLTALISIPFVSRVAARNQNAKHTDFAEIEKVFRVLMIATACAMLFAHGSNDVANAIGPLAAIISLIQQYQLSSFVDFLHHSSGAASQSAPIPLWVLCLGAAGIVSGLVMYGHRVIATIGHEITQLTPSRGFAAQLATASTVVLASGFGLPISTTHALVGAVLGVGFARGMGALKLSVIRNIFMSWIITLPVGAVLSILFYHVFLVVLG